MKQTSVKQPGALLHLAECLFKAVETKSAIRVAAHAVEVARQIQPDLVPQIQPRLIEYREVKGADHKPQK